MVDKAVIEEGITFAVRVSTLILSHLTYTSGSSTLVAGTDGGIV